MTPHEPLATTPTLVGMLHLPPLPGSPRARMPLSEVEARVLDEARMLHDAGFDACILENFGDVPFHADRVEPITIACMSRLAARVHATCPALRLGINVLRNDAEAALAVATAAGAGFIRVNVHVGVTATDQGMLVGRAAETLRLRARLGSPVEIWADVHVKHGQPMSHRDITREAEDAVARGLADALVVSGVATGSPAMLDEVRAVAALDLEVPIYVGSGVTEDNVGEWARIVDGVIIGSALESGGRAGNPLDPQRVRRFVECARGGRDGG